MSLRRYESALLQYKRLVNDSLNKDVKVYQDWFCREVEKVLMEDGITCGDKIVPLTREGRPETDLAGVFNRVKPNGPYPILVCRKIDAAGNETTEEFQFDTNGRGYPFVITYDALLT